MKENQLSECSTVHSLATVSMTTRIETQYTECGKEKGRARGEMRTGFEKSLLFKKFEMHCKLEPNF